MEPFRVVLEAIPEHSLLCHPLVPGTAEGKERGKNAARTAEEAKHRERGMSRACSLQRVALEPRLFAESIGIRKTEQGGEGAEPG